MIRAQGVDKDISIRKRDVCINNGLQSSLEILHQVRGTVISCTHGQLGVKKDFVHDGRV